MRKFTINLISFSLGLVMLPLANAAPSAAQQQLFDQLRMGESSKRDDLVSQSLYRLELIAPNDPEVIAARIRQLLRQGDTAGAQAQLKRLQQAAPDSKAYLESQNSMKLAAPDGRQQLQQARLLATTGHTDEAIAAYQKLFNGNPPQGDIAVEYWLAVAKSPARRTEAVKQLQALNARSPGNNALRASLAQLLFQDNRRDEGFTVLEQMSRSNAGRLQASDIWYNKINNLPPSAASVTALQRYLAVFSEGDSVDAAKARLADQQAKLADPTFRNKAEGLALVDAGQGATAVAPLKAAIAKDQRDADLVGALGVAYSRQGNRAGAVAQLQKALQIDPNNDSHSQWESLLKTNRYWLLIDQGDRALKANNTANARHRYQQARSVDNTDSYAVLGLGDVAVAEKDDRGAEAYYQQALRMDSGNSNAIRGLANVYRRQSPERASQFISSLNARQRNSIDDIERSLLDERLEQQASVLEAKGRWFEAAILQQRRLQQDPGNVWITYRLAKDYAGAGKISQGDAQFSQLLSRKPGDADATYAWALYLSGTNRDEQALAKVNALPKSQWNSNIHELADRIQANKVLDDANRLRDAGQEPQAIALLAQQPASDRIDLTLADWAGQRKDYDGALGLYQKVLARDPQNDDALLGRVETNIARGDKATAKAELAQHNQLQTSAQPSLGTERRIANAHTALGETQQAQQIWDGILPKVKTQPPSMESALVYRDAARFQTATGQPQQALGTYGDAMVASGVTPSKPQDNDSFTRATRNNPKDDWLKRGVRSDAADLYRQQDVEVTLAHDYWGSSGTPGYSDLKAHTTMLQVDAPLSDGTMFFRSDMVNMDEGSFGDGRYDDKWATCYAHTCSGSNKQRANGASIAAGWRNDTWDMDLGTTPIGFDVVDVVGSLAYSSDIGPFGYTVDAHRRPISSSMLSFAGQRDPNTNTTWGGVRASGAGLSLSYDKGEANGVWSSLSADQLTGKNVTDNWRVRWMTGYYYKVVNENDRRVTVGLTNMLWHYDKDLSGYTLGQGGYYSPQQYVSFALPVNWRQRTENWSWELGGSVSWSHSKNNQEPRYPISNLIPDSGYADKYDSESGSSSSGVGYTARALVERRVTSNWFVGAGVDIQQAKDYTPSHGFVYVRYSAAGWQGDMDMPLRPLVPYADW